jgi:hypothetical protein
MKRWMRDIAPQVGLTPGASRLLTGSVGVLEATIPCSEHVIEGGRAATVHGTSWPRFPRTSNGTGSGAARSRALQPLGNLPASLRSRRAGERHPGIISLTAAWPAPAWRSPNALHVVDSRASGQRRGSHQDEGEAVYQRMLSFAAEPPGARRPARRRVAELAGQTLASRPARAASCWTDRSPRPRKWSAASSCWTPPERERRWRYRRVPSYRMGDHRGARGRSLLHLGFAPAPGLRRLARLLRRVIRSVARAETAVNLNGKENPMRFMIIIQNS